MKIQDASKFEKMKHQSLKIYIAGPYSADSESQKLRNVNVAIDLAVSIFLKGHFPYIPHLTHFVAERVKKKKLNLVWKDYIKWDMTWLKVCDALFYLGKSKGAKLELKIAQKKGMKIFYSINEIPNLIKK